MAIRIRNITSIRAADAVREETAKAEAETMAADDAAASDAKAVQAEPRATTDEAGDPTAEAAGAPEREPTAGGVGDGSDVPGCVNDASPDDGSETESEMESEPEPIINESSLRDYAPEPLIDPHGHVITVEPAPVTLIGGGFPADAPVPTPYGMRTIADLRVGMPVFGEDGRQTVVTKVVDAGERGIALLSLSDGRQAEAANDQPWAIGAGPDRALVGGVSTMSDAVVGGAGRRSLRIPAAAGVEFVKPGSRMSPTRAYAMSALLFAGEVTDTGAIGIMTRKVIAQSVAGLLGLSAQTMGDLPRDDGAVRFLLQNSFGRPVRIRSVPAALSKRRAPGWVMTAPVNVRMAFVQGAFDSTARPDGLFSDGLQAFTYSEELARGLATVLRSCGIPCVAKESDGVWSVTVSVTRPEVAKSCLRYRADLVNAISRQDFSGTQPDDGSADVVSIEFDSRYADCVAVSVGAPSHTFLIGDYVVAHDSTDGM